MATPTNTHRIARFLTAGVVAGAVLAPSFAASAESHLTVVHQASPGFEGHTVLIEVAVTSTCVAAPQLPEVDLDCDDIRLDLSWSSPSGRGNDDETLSPSGGSATFQIPKGDVAPGLTYTLSATQDGSTSESGETAVAVQSDSDPGKDLGSTIDGTIRQGVHAVRGAVPTIEGTRRKVEGEAESTRQAIETTVTSTRETIERAVADNDPGAVVDGVADTVEQRVGSPGSTVDAAYQAVRNGETEATIMAELAAGNQAAAAIVLATDGFGRTAARHGRTLGSALQSAATTAVGTISGRVLTLVGELEKDAEPLSGPAWSFLLTMLGEVDAYGDEVCASVQPRTGAPASC